MSRREAAQLVVRQFLDRPEDGFGNPFEDIQVVEMRAGQAPASSGVGVLVTWLQGDHRFGLLMPIERLVQQAGSLEGVGFYLRLAVDEPHEPPTVGERAWFTDLPSAPY